MGFTKKTPDEQLAEQLSKFYADPLGYVMFVFPWDREPLIQQVELSDKYRKRYNCEFGPDVWACEFLDELGKAIRSRGFNGREAVLPIRFTTSSGHGIGKSALTSWIIKFILDTRPYAKGIVTANTSDQLRTKTWAELGKWHGLSLTSHLYEYGSGKGAMTLYRKGKTRDGVPLKGLWRCDAMTCREENSEAFQGLHAANSTPFYIFDEASGIPDSIWDARSGGGTDGEPMSFDFGNPTRRTGYFYENCRGLYKSRYYVRQIDSRNVQLPGKPYIQQLLEDYGEDSDYFKVRVRGEFPSATTVQFISTESVEEAMQRETVDDKNAPLLIGVDVARQGDDDSVIVCRLGYDCRSFPPKRFHGLDTVQLTGRVIETIKEFPNLGKPVSGLFVDGIGIGAGVVDNLRHMGYGPIEVQSGSRPIDHKVYRFKSDEMWGRMRDAMDKLILPGPKDIAGMDLQTQLTHREYTYTIQGNKIYLESKKDMKERGISSPDIADALAFTFAEDVAAVIGLEGYASPLSVIHEYNPLEDRQ